MGYCLERNADAPSAAISFHSIGLNFNPVVALLPRVLKVKSFVGLKGKHMKSLVKDKKNVGNCL